MTKKIYKVTEAQYKTLQEGGTITVGGVSYTYETGSDVAYIVVDPTTPEYRLRQIDDAIQLTKDGTVVSDLSVAYSDRAGYSTFAHTLVYPNTDSATYTFNLYDGGTVNGLTTFNNGISVNSQKITNLATPTANTDAVNKSYVDGKIPTKTSQLTNDSGFKTTDTTYSLIHGATNNIVILRDYQSHDSSITVNDVQHATAADSATTATTATNLTNTPSLLISGSTIAVKAGEKTSSYITVPFATNCSLASSAGSATFDGNGNNIVNTYALKTAAVNSLSVSGTTLSYKDVNGNQLGSVTLPSSTDTKNTAGSSNSTSKLFLVGTTTQSSTGVQSYSNSGVYTQNGQLYTNSLTVSSNANIENALYVTDMINVTNNGVQVNDDDNNYAGTDNFSNADIDTTYYSKGMEVYDNDNDERYFLSYPAKSGTLATTSDIPTYSYDSSTGTLSITTNS